jgi:signal transduction histidine kinase
VWKTPDSGGPIWQASCQLSVAISQVEGAPAIVAPVTGPRHLAFAWARTLPAWARYPSGVALLVGLYWASAHIGYWVGFSGPVASTVWLPAGAGIAFLYLGGLHLWPGILIGDLLVNDYRTLPVGTALAQTVGNVLECVVAAWLLHRLVRTRSPLDTVDGLARGLAALSAGVAVSATVGVAASWIGEVISIDATPHIWRTWFLGDISGALIVVPFAIAWSTLPSLNLDRRRWIEGAVILGFLVGVTEAAFRATHPLVYLVFPALVWSAVRFGKRGATLALVISSALAVWDVTHYEGPFTFHSISNSVLATQLYIVVAVATTLCLAVVVAEREHLAVRLGASRVEVLAAAETERRRVERDLHDGAQQRLIALRVHLRLARDGENQDVLAYADEEIDAAVEELRDLVHGIHPAVLRELSLASALRSLGARCAIPVTFGELPKQPLPAPVEEAVYYIVAEALANTQKHSGASSIRVRVAAENSHVLVETSDNGAGGASESDGSGLRGLRGRAADLGGMFTVTSPPGRGTRVTAVLPLG